MEGSIMNQTDKNESITWPKLEKSYSSPQLCIGGCGHYGHPTTDNMCPPCYQKNQPIKHETPCSGTLAPAPVSYESAPPTTSNIPSYPSTYLTASAPSSASSSPRTAPHQLLHQQSAPIPATIPNSQLQIPPQHARSQSQPLLQPPDYSPAYPNLKPSIPLSSAPSSPSTPSAPSTFAPAAAAAANVNSSESSNCNQHIHHNIACNICRCFPIVGTRYKCQTCVDFDLCSSCEARAVHPSNHPLIKMTTPAVASSASPSASTSASTPGSMPLQYQHSWPSTAHHHMHMQHHPSHPPVPFLSPPSHFSSFPSPTPSPSPYNAFSPPPSPPFPSMYPSLCGPGPMMPMPVPMSMSYSPFAPQYPQGMGHMHGNQQFGPSPPSANNTLMCPGCRTICHLPKADSVLICPHCKMTFKAPASTWTPTNSSNSHPHVPATAMSAPNRMTSSQSNPQQTPPVQMSPAAAASCSLSNSLNSMLSSLSLAPKSPSITSKSAPPSPSAPPSVPTSAPPSAPPSPSPAPASAPSPSPSPSPPVASAAATSSAAAGAAAGVAAAGVAAAGGAALASQGENSKSGTGFAAKAMALLSPKDGEEEDIKVMLGKKALAYVGKELAVEVGKQMVQSIFT